MAVFSLSRNLRSSVAGQTISITTDVMLPVLGGGRVAGAPGFVSNNNKLQPDRPVVGVE